MAGTYKYHLGIYSKLIAGYDPAGPIERGSEARVNGMTAGFPVELFAHCRPTLFFAGAPLITDIDTSTVPGGAFVYSPIQVNEKHYSVFGRVQARSETGEGKPGRKYTHCAMLFVEDKWEPGLIQWAAEMLFTKKHGDRCWGDPVTEYDELRETLPVPLLEDEIIMETPTTKIHAVQNSSGELEVAVRGSLGAAHEGLDDLTHCYPALGTVLGEMFFDHDLSVAGRWMSLAIGIGQGVKGVGKKDFFVRFDIRDDHSMNHIPLPPFDDYNPPKIFQPVSTAGQPVNVDWAELVGPQRTGPRYISLLSDLMLSNFQREYVEAGEPSKPEVQDADPHQISPANLFEDATSDAHDSFEFTEQRPYHAQDVAQWPELDLASPPFILEPEAQWRDTSYEAVFDKNRLITIRPALRQIINRCHVLDPDHGYDRLSLDADKDQITLAIIALLDFTCCYMVLADPEGLKPVMEDLFEHENIGPLGIGHASRGGLLQHLYSRAINTMGRNRLASWMGVKSRAEGQLLIQNRASGYLGATHTIYRCDTSRVNAFFDWLLDVEQVTPDGRCNVDAIDDIAEQAAHFFWDRWELEWGDEED